MAPHASTRAWKIPRMEEPDGLQSMGSRRVDMTERLHFHFSLSCIGIGNGTPFQCSCLENPRDGGAWQATIYGVAQSRTRLKRLSSSSTHTGCQLLDAEFLGFFGNWPIVMDIVTWKMDSISILSVISSNKIHFKLP